METKIKQQRLNKTSKRGMLYNNIYKYFLIAISIIVAMIILVSVGYVFYNGIRVLVDYNVPASDWLFSGDYIPSGASLGILVIIINTLWMSFCALLIAVPVSLGTALIITRTLKPKMSSIIFSIVAILAAVPSVIYGSFGYYVIDKVGTNVLGFGFSSLFTMIIMISFMITPTITIMTIASIRITDKKLEDSSLALGASKTQTSFYITLKAARNGIFTGIVFALGRSVAETTAVSMVGSPLSMYDSLTIAWWQQSIFLGPAILSTGNAELSPDYPMVPILTMAMVFTTLSIFAIMKGYEGYKNEDRVIRRQTNEYISQKMVLEKYHEKGISSLSAKEQNILIKINATAAQNEIERVYFQKSSKSNEYILNRSTLPSTKKFESYKKSKTTQHNVFIYISASIGVILLASIFIFLFNGGFKWFTWDMLTLRGFDMNYDGGKSTKMIGMVVPMMGTYFTMISSLCISLPIGTALGIFLSTYMRKDKTSGQIASFVFQSLTAVPSIVWGTIALIFFGSTIIYTDYIGLLPILFLALLTMPSIIKSVEEAGQRVNSNLKVGSYALGATIATTTRRVYLKEVFPSIISGALLAMSIAMAESTLFAYILKDPSPAYDLSDWMDSSSYTLATLIFNLNSMNKAIFPDAENQIKAVGILMMIIILSISYTSTLVGKKKYSEATLMGAAIILFPFALYINEGSIPLVVITILLAVFANTLVPFIKNLLAKREAAIIKSRGL